MRTLAQMLCLIALSAAVTASAGDDIRWTEEVKLSDGRVIQLQRHVELTESGFPAQKRGFDKYQEICYPPMNIHWKAKAGYKPDIFDIVDGKAYMHVPISDCEKCRLHGFPKSNALVFVWEGGRWKRIEYEKFPEISVWNLLMQTKGGSKETDPKGLITIEDKATGKWNDSSLRFEEKPRNWKRVSDSYYWRDSCNKCGRVNPSPEQAPEIFTNDGKDTCQP